MEEQILNKLENFFTSFHKRTYKKGEVLIRADEPPRGVYFLNEGLVKMYTITKKGDELVLNIFKSPSFFPMSWAINNMKNDYFYESMTDSKVFIAPRTKVIDFITSNNDVLFDLMSRTYRGMDGLLVRMTYLMVGNAYSRLISELIIQVKRFGKKEENFITLKISEKDIAEETGMTRETVSRELHILKNKNLITLENKILKIKNISLLESEIS